MIDSTKLSGYPYSPTKRCDMVCKNSLAVKKKRVQVKYIESYLKDECMVWLTTRGDIWMWPMHRSGARYILNL